MYLKSIEISGFKSFAQKSTIEFRSPVTAIVGPNGSGKSNVAEAFSFVLGEQSLKSMRGKRGEDLIWNGSQESPRANRAVVKAVFDNLDTSNSKKLFNLDFDEVSIERAVNRDGTNEYSVNGTQVRLKDILELLAEAHIGASGYHIISQGEADRILTANIKERRVMLEDALGLKIYQYKRIESERKLEKTFENIREVESLRREIAPHLRFLKKQVDKMSKAVEIKEKLGGLYKEYLKREKVFIDIEKVNIKNEKAPLLEKKENIKRDIDRVREVLKSSESKDGKSNDLLEIESKIRKEREEKDDLSHEAGKLEGEIEANERLIEKMIKKIEAGENITVALKEIEKLAEEIDRETDIGEIKKKIRKFLNDKKVPSEESFLSEIKMSVAMLKEKKESVENRIRQKETSMKGLDDSYSRLREAIEKEKDSSREAEKEILRLSSEATVIGSQIESVSGKEERLKLIEADFLREMEQAVILLGTPITSFADLEVDEQGIVKEERKHQEERRREVERMKIRLEELGAAESGEVMKEFKETSERDAFLERELNDLYTSSKSLRELIAELEEKLHVEFKEGIGKINSAFNDFFSLMFGGGKAELEIVEQKKKVKKAEDGIDESVSASSDEEAAADEGGIDIFVSLPKKRIKGLVMLSGGERALTSIALLFAISQVNPPPFIVLDETDAALDEANSKKYGDMIESLSKFSQLILITHNRETMSRAGVIYGVTMGPNGVSRLLSVALDEAVAAAK